MKDMIGTANDLISEDVAGETIGSRGDLPPMTDEGRRADVQDQHAMWQSSEPKPISHSRNKGLQSPLTFSMTYNAPSFE